MRQECRGGPSGAKRRVGRLAARSSYERMIKPGLATRTRTRARPPSTSARRSESCPGTGLRAQGSSCDQLALVAARPPPRRSPHLKRGCIDRGVRIAARAAITTLATIPALSPQSPSPPIGAPRAHSNSHPSRASDHSAGIDARPALSATIPPTIAHVVSQSPSAATVVQIAAA